MQHERQQDSQRGEAFSTWALELLLLAREYCAYLQQETTHSPTHLLKWLYEFWALLFYKATRMPTTSNPDEHEGLPVMLTELEYETLRQHIEQCLGPDDAMGMPIHPDERALFDGTPTLSEIATDLYQLFYELLCHYRDGVDERMLAALNDFHYYFYEYRGAKLLLGLRELHWRYLQSYLNPDDSNND